MQEHLPDKFHTVQHQGDPDHAVYNCANKRTEIWKSFLPVQKHYKELIYKIDSGRIRPSKSLQDSIAKMLQGNREFIMLDEQKVVYEDILNKSRQSVKDDKKRVVIVKGGPGTGKSVVAVNLLVELTKEEQFCQYVSKNSAPRNVYRKKLKGSIRKSSVDNMFKGSGIYTETNNNMIDTILVDEYDIIGQVRRRPILKAS